MTRLWSISHNQIALLIFRQYHLESSHSSICLSFLALSLKLPLPLFLLAGQTGHVCGLGNEKMGLFATPLRELPLRCKRSPFVAFFNIGFYLFPPLEGLFLISCPLFNIGSYLSQAGFYLWSMYTLCFYQTANLLKASLNGSSYKRSLIVFIVQYSVHALWLSTGYNTTSRLLSKMLPLSTNHLAECEFCCSGGNHYRDSQKRSLQIARAQILLDWGVCTGAWLKKKHGH